MIFTEIESPEFYEPERSIGLHHSQVLNSICLDRGIYAESDDEVNAARLKIGQAHERAVAEAIFLNYPNDFEYKRNIELVCEGIYITTDLICLNPFAPYEVKWTKISSKNGPGSDKFWKYEVQLKSQLRALRSKTGIAYLDVFHVEGDYSQYFNDPVRRTHKYQFTMKEIDDNWSMILAQAREKFQHRC